MPVLYASSPRRAAAQILTDAAMLTWVLACAAIAELARRAVVAVGRAGQSLSDHGDAVGRSFDSAAERVSGVPLVGDRVAGPLRDAASSVHDLATTGSAQAHDAGRLAWLVFTALFVLPLVPALLAWLPPRVRFVREATAVRRYVRAAPDLELLALRALVHQPMHRLTRVAADPEAGYRDRNPEVMRALAGLELADAGGRLPRRPSA